MRRELCALLALAWAFCVGMGVPSAQGEALRVGHDLWIGYAGVFIAEEKGFFKEEGVEVELRSFSGPGDSLPPLIAGHLDLNLTTLHNLALVAGTADGPPLDVVYLIDASYGADAVVAKTSIKSVADLKGKRIGVTLGEANHLFLLVALESAGLKESDVELVNVSADDAGAAFMAGNLDAAVTWEPWVSKALSGGGHVVFSTKDAPNLVVNAIVAPEKTRVSRAKDVAGFIRAIDRGVAYLAEHPEESKAILAKKLESSPEDVAGMLAGDQIYDLEANRKLLLAEEPAAFETMKKILAFLEARELVTQPVEPAALFDTQFLGKERAR